jgi:hypothetical protein
VGGSLRNFQFSMLNTLQSPQYYSILAGSDINGDGFPLTIASAALAATAIAAHRTTTPICACRGCSTLTERWKLNASAEALNVFNRVNVQDVDQVYGAGEFSGAIPKSYGDGVTSPDNPTFGTPTFAGAARQIQLSLKLKF